MRIKIVPIEGDPYIVHLPEKVLNAGQILFIAVNKWLKETNTQFEEWEWV